MTRKKPELSNDKDTARTSFVEGGRVEYDVDERTGRFLYQRIIQDDAGDPRDFVRKYVNRILDKDESVVVRCILIARGQVVRLITTKGELEVTSCQWGIPAAQGVHHLHWLLKDYLGASITMEAIASLPEKGGAWRIGRKNGLALSCERVGESVGDDFY